MSHPNSPTLKAHELFPTFNLNERRKIDQLRGLASFPVESETDRLGIACVSAWRADHVDGTVCLPHAPIQIALHPLLSDDLVYYLLIGDYEQNDLDLIEQYVRLGDRVLDVGGGAGVCAIRMGQRAQTEVVIVEPRKDLFGMIEHNLRLNEVAGKMVYGALTDRVPLGTRLPFTVCDNLWFSSLTPNATGKIVQVPSLTLEHLYHTYQPDVVLLDIEGGETHLNFATQHRPRVVMMEIHTPFIGNKATCQVIQRLADQGYRVINMKAQTWVFERS